MTDGSTTYTPVFVRKFISGFSVMPLMSPSPPSSTTPYGMVKCFTAHTMVMTLPFSL